MKRARHPKPLRVSLTLLVLACWVLPVAAAGLVGMVYMTAVTHSRVEKSIIQQADTAASQVMEQLNYAIEMSRNISRVTPLYDLTRVAGYNPLKAANTRRPIQNILSLMYSYQNNIVMAALYLWDDPYSTVYIDNTSSSNSHYMRTSHETVTTMAQGLDSRIGFYITDDEIYLIRNILDRYTYLPYGTLVLRLNSAVVLNSLQNMEWEPGVLYNLSGQWGGVRTEARPDAFFDSFPYGYAVQTDQSSVYYQKWKKTDYAFSIRIETPLSLIFPERRLLTMIEAVLVVLIVPMLAIVLVFFQRNVNKPIYNLLYAARRLEAGELGVTTDVIRSSAEFSFLSRTFNGTSLRLKELFDKVYKEELAVRDAKILALRSQMNPHFLNNTLELMNWKARMSGADEISDMIGALATLMDAAMNRLDVREVTLEEELSFAEAYIYIMTKRFGSRLRFAQDIDENLLNVLTPPLIIQPLMENAVIHSLEKRPEGELRLSVAARDGEMVVEVFNTGELSAADGQKIRRLLTQEYAPDQESSAHLGISNVQQRLTLLYGEGSRLTIENRDGGTVARVNLPIRHESEEF